MSDAPKRPESANRWSGMFKFPDNEKRNAFVEAIRGVPNGPLLKAQVGQPSVLIGIVDEVTKVALQMLADRHGGKYFEDFQFSSTRQTTLDPG